MELDTQKVRELLNKRDAIDEEMQAIFSGGKERKAIKCGSCGEEGHSARTCPQKPQ